RKPGGTVVARCRGPAFKGVGLVAAGEAATREPPRFEAGLPLAFDVACGSSAVVAVSTRAGRRTRRARECSRPGRQRRPPGFLGADGSDLGRTVLSRRSFCRRAVRVARPGYARLPSVG